MNSILRIIAISAVIAPTGALANTWTCTHNDLVRTVSIEKSESSVTACNVNYTKETEGVAMQTLWSAENQLDYCQEKAEGLVSKLTSWGWDCTIADAATPEMAPENESASEPEAAPEAAPEATPEATPEAAPEATPEQPE